MLDLDDVGALATRPFTVRNHIATVSVSTHPRLAATVDWFGVFVGTFACVRAYIRLLAAIRRQRELTLARLVRLFARGPIMGLALILAACVRLPFVRRWLWAGRALKLFSQYSSAGRTWLGGAAQPYSRVVGTTPWRHAVLGEVTWSIAAAWETPEGMEIEAPSGSVYLPAWQWKPRLMGPLTWWDRLRAYAPFHYPERVQIIDWASMANMIHDGIMTSVDVATFDIRSGDTLRWATHGFNTAWEVLGQEGTRAITPSETARDVLRMTFLRMHGEFTLRHDMAAEAATLDLTTGPHF